MLDLVDVKLKNSTETPSFKRTFNSIILEYPCSKTYECSPYEIKLPRGIYIFSLYGASGGYSTHLPTTIRSESEVKCKITSDEVIKYGGNTNCNTYNVAGAGGFISGTIILRHPTKIYAYVGGKGQIATTTETSKGGFNGGGDSTLHSSPAASGGGASDIRIEEDDLWHRVIVAGGGGGSDDQQYEASTGNDGTGGAGGYPEAQGYWSSGKYNGSHVATQLYGFSFGQGESANALNSNHKNSSTYSILYENAGAGGGWFGGHSSRNYNSGAGGGSSFILTKNASIPKGEIATHSQLYDFKESKKYAFRTTSQYAMTDISYQNGIRAGNGVINITFASSIILLRTKCNKQQRLSAVPLLISFIS